MLSATTKSGLVEQFVGLVLSYLKVRPPTSIVSFFLGSSVLLSVGFDLVETTKNGRS